MKRLIPVFLALTVISLISISRPAEAQYRSFEIQFGIWQSPSGGQTHYPEKVSSRYVVSGGPGTGVNVNMGSPASWWEVFPTEQLNWSRADLFHRMGLILWERESGMCLLKGPEWGTDGACPEYAEYFFPMVANVTITATPAGGGATKTLFSQQITWEHPIPQDYGGYGFYWFHNRFASITNYGEMPTDDWVSPVNYRDGSMTLNFQVVSQPDDGGSGTIYPPNYTIDYSWERTNKVVGSDDQYSFNNSNWTTGSGSYLNLTPGTTVYFRKVADWSKTQTLNVPNRPSAPSYTVNYTSEQTAQTVASTVHYSTSSDMSDAVNGSGTNVSLTPGTDLYFRYKATSSAFASSVFTLDVKDRPAAPSVGIDFPNEKTSSVITTSMEYSVSSDMSGAITGTGSAVGLTPGTDLYIRNKATASNFSSGTQTLLVPDRPSQPAFTINYLQETTNETVDSNYEYGQLSDLSDATTGSGSAAPVTPGASLYIRHRATVSDFRSATQDLAADDRPAGPSISIDYLNETTVENISSDMEYSSSENMSGAQSGTGTSVAVSPGTNLYFRTVATASTFSSETFTLVVPARPAGPSFTIDYENEQTKETAGSTVEVADNPEMTGALTGSGEAIALVPGSNKYFRSLATASAFASKVATLIVPMRPAKPLIVVDYVNERTASVVSSDLIYSFSEDMSDAISGNNQQLNVSPDMNIYFQKKATPSFFRSEIQALELPPRPEVPQISIDFENEETSSFIGSDMEYALNAAMNPSSTGNGSRVSLIPGMDLYFRVKASTGSFASEKYHLDVPERPVISCGESGSTVSNPLPVLFFFYQEAGLMTPERVSTVNSRIENLKLESTTAALSTFSADIVATAQGQLLVQIEPDALPMGNFSSEVFTIEFTGEPSGIEEEMAGNLLYSLYPNPASGSFRILSKTGGQTMALVEIYSVTGEKLASMDLDLGNETIIPVPEAASGLCFVQIRTDAGVSVMKLIVR